MRRLARLPTVQGAGGGPTGADVQRLADAGVRGATASLPHLNRISQAFGPGHDLSGVRARVGGTGAAATQAMGAHAYATRGDRVAFAAAPGLRVAAHEAAHLVQQKGGLSLPGGVGKVGDAHERHADAVADRVVRGQSARDLLQRYAGPQAKTAPAQAQTQTHAASGRAGVQMWKALVKAPWMAAGAWDSNMAGGKVSYMKARNLSLNLGAVVGAGKNAPSVAPKSWNQLWTWKLTHMRGPPNYVRMHMLSDRLGGPGNVKDNLAPGTNGFNQRHYNRVEKPLINALNGGGEVKSYKITPTYQTLNGGLKSAKGKAAWNNTLRRIHCTAAYSTVMGGPTKNLVMNISETAGINGKKNWKGH